MKKLDFYLSSENEVIKNSFFIEKTEDTDCELRETLEVTIKNANEAFYKGCFDDYKVYISKDNKNWVKADECTNTDEGYKFNMPAMYNYACYYPDYHLEKLLDFVKFYGLTYNKLKAGQPYFVIGSSSRPAIVLTSRLIPGDNIASFVTQAILQEVIKTYKHLFKDYCFIFFPFVNISGFKALNQFNDAFNYDLTTDWSNFNSKHSTFIKKFINISDSINEDPELIPHTFINIQGDFNPKTTIKVECNLQNNIAKALKQTLGINKDYAFSNVETFNPDSVCSYFESLGYSAININVSYLNNTPSDNANTGKLIINKLAQALKLN
jgi:hypothetical protein